MIKKITLIVLVSVCFSLAFAACANQSVSTIDSDTKHNPTVSFRELINAIDSQGDTKQDSPSTTHVDTHKDEQTETRYSLPPEADFYAFVETRLYEEIYSGRLALDTALERPVEIEVISYHLPGSSPEIRVDALVFEQDVGENNGKAITRQIVEILLEWLDNEGFVPYGSLMMPISYIYMETMDDAGNIEEKWWGHSMYNPFTGIIE